MKAVVDEVAAEMNVSPKDIQGKARFKHIVEARTEVIRRLYVLNNKSSVTIGEFFDMQPKSVWHHLHKAGVHDIRSRLHAANDN